MPLFFVLIPYFTERQEAMRIPVVTFAAMGLCLLVFVLGRGSVHQRGAVFEVAIETAADHARLHPDLDDSELRRLWEDLGRPGSGQFHDEIDAESLLGEEFAELFPEVFSRTDRDPAAEGDQTTLDALVANAREEWRRQPWVRFGLVRDEFRILGLFTHVFLHAGWLHLLGNLLFLWLAMSSLENIWNRGVLAGFYLACGAISGGLQMLWMGDQPLVPLVGASGAISGLMGAYLICFARSRIRMWYLMWIIVFARSGTFQWPAWVALPLWFIYQLLSWLGLGAQDVGYAAHLGGFVAGSLGALAFTRSAIYARFNFVPESDMPFPNKEARRARIAHRRTAPEPRPAPRPPPPAAPWEDSGEGVTATRPADDTPGELVANIHDWMASSEAGAARVPAPSSDVPGTDDSVPQTPATARPPADRFTTDESLMVSAPWGRVSDPGEDEPMTATLRPRTSKLTAIEPHRLSLETADGAPFKVPCEHVIGVFPARIGGEDPFGVCDLIQGIHRTASGVLVETVRLPAPLQDCDKLLTTPPAGGDEPFVVLVRQLRTGLAFVRTWPDSGVDAESEIPGFDHLEEYERALLACIAEEG